MLRGFSFKAVGFNFHFTIQTLLVVEGTSHDTHYRYHFQIQMRYGVLESIANFLNEEIDEIFKDIAGLHYQSAKQAFQGVETSNNRDGRSNNRIAAERISLLR